MLLRIYLSKNPQIEQLLSNIGSGARIRVGGVGSGLLSKGRAIYVA